MRPSASIVVRRPIEDVFGFITDVDTMPRWVAGVTDSRPVSTRIGVGARFVVDYAGGRRPYELEVVVTAFDPPVLFESQISRGPFSFEGRFELERVDGDDGEGTRVTSLVEAGDESLATRVAMILFGPFIRGSMRRRLLGELEALRDSIQGTAPAGPS